MPDPTLAAPAAKFPRLHVWTWRLITLTALLLIAALGAYSYSVAAQSVRNLVSDNNDSAAKITAVLLKRELDRSISFAQTLATLPGTAEMVERRDAEAIRARLKTVVESNAGIDRALLAATDGTILSDYPIAPEMQGRSITDREWHRGVSDSSQPYVTGVFKRLADPQPLVVVVAAPVKSNGKPVGVIAIHYRLEGLAEWLGQVRVGDDGYIVVLDPKGVVAVHPKLNLQDRQYEEYSALDPIRRSLDGAAVNTEFVDPFEKRVVVGSFEPVTIAGRRWVILAQQPKITAYAPIRALRVEIFIAAVVVAALGLALLVVLGRISAQVERLNAALRERNHTLQQLALIVQSSNDAILSTTLDGTILSWNPGCERLYGYTAEEAVGRSAGILISKNQPGELAENLSRIRNGQRIENRESIRIAKDGRELSVALSVAPLRSETGAIEGATTIARNVTEQRRAETALRESIDRFQLVARGTNDGLWDWNIDTNRVYFSSRWKEMLGYRDDEIEHNFDEWERRLHPQDRERSLATIKDYLEGRSQKYELEHRLLHKDGAYRWILARGYALRDAAGKPYRMAGSHVDLTERKKAAEDLANKAKELSRSNAELEQFAYVASHDLREPLRMINSYGQLLARHTAGKLDADTEAYLRQVLDGAARMKNLIDDLLEYSRVGSRGITITPVDCNAIFAQTVQNLKIAIEESGASVTATNLPRVRGDAVQLTQLLQNLIENALKFKGAAPPRIEVSAQQRGSEWLFAVKDNGIGIDPQHFKRIFAIFTRLHTRDEYPGTGIGLTICKRIVERLGGMIWVESEPGHGSTFFFTLPC